VNVGFVDDCRPNWYDTFSTYDLRAASRLARSLCSEDDAMAVVNALRRATAVREITSIAIRISTSVSPASERAATTRSLHNVNGNDCCLE
jgi:hypothetical protein